MESYYINKEPIMKTGSSTTIDSKGKLECSEVDIIPKETLFTLVCIEPYDSVCLKDLEGFAYSLSTALFNTFFEKLDIGE